MNIQAEKLELIEWLVQLSDEKMLTILKSLKSQKKDWWDGLSTEEKRDIKEGIAELDNGDKVSYESVMSKFRL